MHNRATLPLVLYPRASSLHLGHHDCDCACALDLPHVLAAPSVARLHDCDCACALDLAAAPNGPPALVPWVKRTRLVPIPLDGEWQAFFNPQGPVGVATLNPEAQQILAAFESPLLPGEAASGLPGMSGAVIAAAVEDLARVGLLRPVAHLAPSTAGAATLSAWLHTTEACNLNCLYCYVHKHPRAMTEEVGRRAVDKLLQTARRHGYGALKLKYAGGEPALNFPLVRAIHAYAAHRAAGAGLALEGVLLTNGVGVTDAMLDFVAQTAMHLMVSLDGGPSVHDRMRASRDGRSTHASVTGTVERALDRGLRPSISITLTAPSLEGAGEAVAFALERDLPFNLNFYRECTTGGAAPMSLVPDPARLVERLLGIFDLIGRYPAYPWPLTGILDRTRLDVPHDHPCSAGRDYLVVGTMGQVSACQMLLDEPWANLADEDPLDAVRRRGEPAFRAPAEDSNCHGCRWRVACGGGCPLLRGSEMHDRYCRVYQALLPQLVRLEARRLISSGSPRRLC
jgi:uncharacterized protein